MNIIEGVHSTLAYVGGLTKQALRVEALAAASRQYGDGLRDYLKAVLDPSFNYYYTLKGLPPAEDVGLTLPVTFEDMLVLLNETLHQRLLTGHDADIEVGNFLFSAPPLLRDLFRWAIDRKLPGGVGRNIVNAVYPDLIYKQPYPGVKPYDADAIEKFPWSKGMMVQPKADGMALMIEIGSMQVRTRAGQDVSLQMKEYLKPLSWVLDPATVWFVEVNLWNEDFTKMLPRPESNGILNSIFKTGRKIRRDRLVITALDAIPVLEFYGNIKPKTKALERYDAMMDAVCDYNTACQDGQIWPQLDAVPTEILYSPAEAREYCQYLIANGGEGAVIKDPKAPHKDGKSGMKMKNEFECTLLVIGWKPHSKIPGAIGSLRCVSDDNEIDTYVGSGLNEIEGDDLCRLGGYDRWHGLRVEIKAEKISKNNALDLPRIVEIRRDKERADNFEEVKAALADSQSINNC